MFLDYFGLASEPFTISPDPHFLYLTSQHAEAIGKCSYAIQQKNGLTVVYGDVGTGKTTIARRLFQMLSEDKQNQIAMMITPDLKTETAFLRAIMAEFGVAPKRSYAASLDALLQFAAKAHADNKNLILLVDEAQQMTPKMLEVVRVLMNFETDNAKFIQVVLFGQNELMATLNTKEMRAIKSRVGIFAALSSLGSSDTSSMIEYRWRAAGGSTHPFTAEAVQEVFRQARGLAREIIKLCNESLNRAVVNESRQVTASMVKIAAKSLHLNEVK